MEQILFHIGIWLFTIIFFIRILTQIFVGIYSPAFLPKMDLWYSGVMPYPYLLTYQMFMYTCMVIFNFCFFMRKGPLFIFLNDSTYKYFICFGVIYFCLMIFRFIRLKIKWPDIKWPRGSIPVLFHFVLSSYIILIGCYPFFKFKINFN
jgi:hypothetical protein